MIWKKASHTDAEDDEAVAFPLAGRRGGIIDVSLWGSLSLSMYICISSGFTWRHICIYIHICAHNENRISVYVLY